MTALATEFVEREYNLRAAFPDHLVWLERWADDSETARSRLDVVPDVRYGRGPKQTLDLFPATQARGTLLFVHGGYWRGLDKSDHSFIAPEFVARGIGVAIVNYDLCPAVGIARIVEECREAVAWLRREGGRYGVPSHKFVVGGHSAGGHLAAMLFATDWSRHGLSPPVIAGGFSVSGVFDLEPLVRASFNADLRLDIGKARAVSPIYMPPRTHAPLVLAAGANETDEFIRQSWLLWERWPECHPDAMKGPLFVPERHHFSVLGDLADPKSTLFAAALRLFDDA